MASTEPENEDAWSAELHAEEALRLRREEPPPPLAHEEFLAWRSPREGSANPTRLDNPLWQWMVRTGWDAYNANKLLAGPSAFDAGPMWSFQRFGKSETALADGRVVHIGGEHEDSYDPDFHIYNDVTVVDPAGGIAMYGYPMSDFPATDFHSATLVGNAIFIIGRLGYPEGWASGTTPVYKLLLDSMRIEAVATQGDVPGWIYKHAASLEGNGRIRVSGGMRNSGNARALRQNLDSWALDTESGQWERLTSLDWQQWIMWRVDRKRNRLWETRQSLWNREHAHMGFTDYWSHDEPPDFAALADLYRFENGPPPDEGEAVGAYSIVVDGLTIRFNESGYWVEAIVEGRLAPERLALLQRETMALLERIDNAGYELESDDS